MRWRSMPAGARGMQGRVPGYAGSISENTPKTPANVGSVGFEGLGSPALNTHVRVMTSREKPYTPYTPCTFLEFPRKPHAGLECKTLHRPCIGRTVGCDARFRDAMGEPETEGASMDRLRLN